jgi:hypothetical protein
METYEGYTSRYFWLPWHEIGGLRLMLLPCQFQKIYIKCNNKLDSL